MIEPKLLSIIKNSPEELKGKNLTKEIIAGIIVAIIALPLSIALAISSGVSPEKGMITAIIAGFLISFLGGSRVQIGGPTAAFVVIICSIIAEFGFEGLVTATIMAGIILVIFGLVGFGDVIKFIPQPITVGFTCGIAVTLFFTQLNDFTGMNLANVPSEFIEKGEVYLHNLDKINFIALAVGVLSIVINLVWGKINKKLPGSLIALILTTVIVNIFDLPVETIGSKFSEISSSIPKPSIVIPDLETVGKLLPSAVTIAILAGIESLLSAVVADGMTGDKHNSNTELVAQGIANIASGLFGGLPATGAIARTAANIKNGGTTPIAGMVHAIVLLIIMLVAMPLAKLIPMPTLAGILIVVAYNMCEFREFKEILHTTKSDALVLIVTFILTVIFDLVVAIEIGMVLAMFLFINKMSKTMEINETVPVEKVNSIYANKELLVYKIDGPIFFGATTKFLTVMKSLNIKSDILILNMKSVPLIDGSALDALHNFIDYARKYHIMVLFSGLKESPMNVLEKSGIVDSIGRDRFFDKLDDAVKCAEDIIKLNKELKKKRNKVSK